MTRPPPPTRVRIIDLTKATSAMDAIWAASRAAERAQAEARRRPVPEGKVWCEGCRAHVPSWFWRGCMADNCALQNTMKGR